MKRIRKSAPVPNDPIVKLVPTEPRSKKMVSDATLARSRMKPAKEKSFVMPSYPKGVMPQGSTEGRHPLALDQQIIEVNAWASQNLYAGAFNNGATFLGYPYLSELAQIPEYRKIVETVAMHMTRKFITLQVVGEAEDGEQDKTKKIKELTDELENFKIRDLFRKAAEVDGYFGRSHLYIDLVGAHDPKELRMPIGNGRDALSQLKVKKGMLKGFKIIEPVWTYPGNYNSNNPLTNDWYNPQTWFVMQKEIHESRCLRLVGREVPDLLKPAYSFGGLSLSQMAKPYVDNWLRTRQSVADVIWSFSTSGVLTDMQTTMQSDGEQLFARAELFNNLRNNRGMMLLNKDSEEFFQMNTPLGTLDKLQAQAQEHMASVSSIPLVFLLGITPSGLNASSEGEIRAFYDFINAFQTKLFTEPLTRVIDFIQLNKYGFIDPDIIFMFEPLWSMTEKEQAEVDKITAETDDLRINDGVISPLEARKRVANSPDTPYAGLDVTELPVPPGSSDNDGDGEIEPDEGETPQPDGPGGPPRSPNSRIGGESDDDDTPFAQDEGFKEDDHPRGQPKNAGQFGAGGGGGEGGNTEKATVEEFYGSYGVKHGGDFVKNKQGNKKLFGTPEAAEKFASTYTGEESTEKKKPKNNSGGQITPDGKYKRIATTGEYHELAKKSEKQLSAEDKEAIAYYTSPEYAALNKSLRGDKPLSEQSQRIVDNLDRLMSESHLAEDVTLFRGVRGKKVREQLDALLPGDTITDHGFVSTSVSKDVASSQADQGQKSTMVIRAPKGGNAVFPGEHSYNAKEFNEGGGKYDDAFEVMLPRKSQFKFIGKKGATYEFEYVPSDPKAHDEAQWNESKHPRGQPGNAGQFGSGGGGSVGESKAPHHQAIHKILKGTAGISGKYRQQIQNLLKEPGLNEETKTKLKHKLVESYTAKSKQLFNAGDNSKAAAVMQKAQKIAKTIGAPTPAPLPAVQVPIKTPTFPAPGSGAKKHIADKSHAFPGKFIIKNPNGQVLGNNGEFGMGISTKKFDTKEAAEKEAAVYDKMAAEGKTPAKPVNTPAALNAFTKNELSENIPNWSSLSKDDQDSLADLASFTGVTDAKSQYHEAKKLIEEMKQQAPNLTPAKAAHILAYSGSHYSKTNSQLRGNELDEETWNHAKQLNEALETLPKFEGTTRRGTEFKPEELAKWQVGKVVADHGFMSSSNKSKGFNGSVQLTIHSKNGRDISKLSHHPNEKEVLFKAGTRFKIEQRTQSNGKTHMTIREV